MQICSWTHRRPAQGIRLFTIPLIEDSTFRVYNFTSRMSRSPKSMILVVLMFAHVVSDLQISLNISDSNTTTLLLKDPQRNLSEKQKTSQPKLVDEQLSLCNDSAPSDIDAKSSECNVSLNISSDKAVNRRESLYEEVLFLFSPVITIFIPSFFTLVFIVSVPLNICAVLVFVWRIKLKKAASIYMLNLACADLLFATVLPFKIFYHFNGNNWIFGSAICTLSTGAFFWNMYCSVLLIACISIDRLLAVVYPMESLTWRSPRKAVIACIAMWVLSFIGTMDIFMTEHTLYLEQLNITICYDLIHSELSESYKVYLLTVTCLLFFLPLVFTMVSYIWVIMTLRKAQQGVPGHDRKKRRAVVLALTVLVMFVLCFTPTNCLCIVIDLDYYHSDSLDIVYQVFLCLGSVNCLLDPLVYYFGSSKFQKELSSMLG